MKKISYIGIAILVAGLCSSSCDVMEKPEAVDPSLVGTQGAYTIVAETESSSPVKAGISGNDADGYDVIWENGDDIYVHPLLIGTNSLYSGAAYVSKGAGTTKAYFNIDKPVDPLGEIWAPASLGILSARLTWPSEQSYSAECKVKGIPMYCTSIEETETSQSLQFKNLGGLLRFTVKGDKALILTGIDISSTNPVAGSFGIDASSGISVASFSSDPGSTEDLKRTIHLDIPSVALSPEGAQFHISMIPGSYDGVSVKFTFSNNSTVTKTLGRSLVIERSRITSATVSMPDVGSFKPGSLISYEAQRTIQPADIVKAVVDAIGTTNPLVKNLLSTLYILRPVKISRITYFTTGPDGSLKTASGVVAYQHISSTYEYDRIVSIQHGTCDIKDAPSLKSGIPMEMLPVTIYNEKTNYVAIMADYLGYGVSQTADLQHPYMHSELTGGCCADMLTAAEAYLETIDVKVGSGIDLIGYSQGGAATLQTLIELENEEKHKGYKDRINEVWAGAGPYDLVEFMNYFNENTNSYDKIGFVPYSFRGICYGESLDVDNSNIYNSDLLENVDVDYLFSHSQLSEWHSALAYKGNGTTMADILHPDFFVAGYNSNADIINLVDALEKNSVVSHTTEPYNVDKIKLYHNSNDDTVPYNCSENLRMVWPDLDEIIPLNEDFTHLKGGIQFLLTYCGMGDWAQYL